MVACQSWMWTFPSTGVFEEIALLEIGEESGDGFVGLGAVLAEGGLDVGVLIPGAVAEFDETDACLGKAAGEEALSTEAVGRVFVDAVERQSGVGLGGKVHDFGDGVLHAKGEFVAFDGAFDERRVHVAAEFLPVEGIDEIDLLALILT